MTLPRLLLCIFLPPFAVLDKGCGSFGIVLLFTILGWVPGIIAAIIILNRDAAPGKQFTLTQSLIALLIIVAVILFVWLIISLIA